MTRKQLALAKISPPRLHDALPRTRLFIQLDEALQHPVAWLCAQPGAGKTTLVASYLRARQGGDTGIWYQVDDGDADPASFIYHVRLAAASADESAPALPLLTPEYRRDLRGFARRFFRELFSRLQAGAVLVLDNLQEVPEDSALHRMVAEGMVQLPAGVHLIVISRSEPEGVYAPLLAADAIALLDGEMLRLTLDETQAIAHKRGVQVGVEALHARSHGWAAGLTLLLTRTRRRAVADDDDESLQHVFGYFAQRVFDDATPEQQHVLLQLAVLPQMPIELAVQLSGRDDTQRLLEGLYKRHLFTDRRRVAVTAAVARSAQDVYQFHALFRSFLLHRAREQLGPEGWHDVVGRAARLLDTDGQWEQALTLFAECGDWAGYVCTMVTHAERLLDQGRQQSLGEWLARVPATEREREPWLAYWEGRALMQLAPARALQVLQANHLRFARDGDIAGQLASVGAIVQTLWYSRLGWSEITRWVDHVEPLIGKHVVAFPSPAVELMTFSALHAALAFCRLAHAEVMPMGRRLLALIDDTSIDWNQRLSTATHLMTWLHNAAELDLAHQLIAKVDPVIDERPSSVLNRSYWFTFRAIYDMRHGRDDVACQRYQRAEDLARTDGLVHAEYAAMQFRTYLDLFLRRVDEARARIARMEVHPARGHPDAELHYFVCQALLAQMQRRWPDALAHAQRALEAIEAIDAAYFRVVYTVTLASTFADCGQPERALAIVTQARDAVRGTRLDVMRAQLLLEEAYIALTQLDEAGARARLEQGLQLAASDRMQAAYIHRIVARCPQLLEVALRYRIELDLVHELIRRWRVPPPAEAPAAWPWPVKVKTLGGFEVRVRDEPIAFGRKAPKKTLALLKAVIARGGSVGDGALIDQFWPDEEGDAAAKSLGAALHRLRALLGVPDAVVQLGGQVSLERDCVWVDAWALERGLASTSPAEVLEALSLYQGAFLAEDEGESWSVAMRERLRGKFVHAVANHASRLETAQLHEEAIAWYLRGLDADSVVEPFYQGLMRCYHRLDRLPEAVSAYRRCKQILSVTLSLPPSAGTEKLYQTLRLE
jgi:ATP/maltotriose-dependent transcriptional regulator MalT/DNA-binding SARP family transcriptional activator